ncbi:LiaF transmembrane domain-containing protein [Sphingobacterium sp. NGMCC 1.201703]|uniref:LiaF transmembrane domain-containing protein n=1 Tax=unclassified Sphingobacterium TaxID=2609468 RepID=UPI0009840AD3|nr:LiaF domain-containing protein [Sphingobacterium sp. CZ-UAM]
MEKEPIIPNSNNSRNIVGAIVIIIGIFLLLHNLNLGDWFPGWLFGWQMILIIIGLVIGINSQFQKKSAIILLIIGGASLISRMMRTDFGSVTVPIIIISLGIYFIMSKRKPPMVPPTYPNPPQDPYDWDKRVNIATDNPVDTTAPDVEAKPFNDQYGSSQQASPNAQAFGNKENSSFHQSFEDSLNLNSIFAGQKKVIYSKQFRGGNLTNVFGSIELDLTKADIQQPIVIDTFQLFGSARIIVPPHWTVFSNVASILGSVDDRRFQTIYNPDTDKKIYITGTCILGNLTIKNA